VLSIFHAFIEFNIKDIPFITVSPTNKYFKLMEKSDTRIRVKVQSKCQGVPYCDTFSIEEEYLILSPSATS
jgi:hypothetical protein